MTDFLIHFAVWTVVLFINSWVTIKMYHFNNRRRQKLFLRHLRIEHPESTIILSALESSDLEALDNLKEQLDELS